MGYPFNIPFNITRWSYVLGALDVAIDGILIYNIKDYIPLSVRNVLVYSRSIKRKFLARVMELPKSWLRLVFLIVAPRSTLSLYVGVSMYFFGGQLPPVAWIFLDPLLGSSRKPIVPAAPTLLAEVLILLYLYKKLYESIFVNIYSDRKMTALHHFFSLWYYFTSPCGVIGESIGYVRHSRPVFYWENLHAIDFIAAVVFLIAVVLQFQYNQIVSESKKGGAATKLHKIPHGGLFNYVTGVLQFLEIVMYLMLSIILRKAVTFHYVTTWVLLNQVVIATDLHLRYKKTFEDYPQERKIILPFVF